MKVETNRKRIYTNRILYARSYHYSIKIQTETDTLITRSIKLINNEVQKKKL